MSKPNSRLASTDYYPVLGETLLSGQGGSGTRASNDSTNLAGVITRTEGGWIGLRLHMMFPDEVSAKLFLPQLIELINRTGLKSGNLLAKQLKSALEGNDTYPIESIWFEDCGELTRSGRRQASEGQ